MGWDLRKRVERFTKLVIVCLILDLLAVALSPLETGWDNGWLWLFYMVVTLAAIRRSVLNLRAVKSLAEEWVPPVVDKWALFIPEPGGWVE